MFALLLFLFLLLSAEHQRLLLRAGKRREAGQRAAGGLQNKNIKM